MAYYDEFIELAHELINETGRSISVKLYDGAASDNTLPWKGPGTPTEKDSVTAMATFIPTGDGFGTEIIPEELLSRVNEVCLMAPVEGKDLMGYTKIMDDTLYGIEWAWRLKPGSQVVLYAFGIKR